MRQLFHCLQNYAGRLNVYKNMLVEKGSKDKPEYQQTEPFVKLDGVSI